MGQTARENRRKMGKGRSDERGGWERESRVDVHGQSARENRGKMEKREVRCS